MQGRAQVLLGSLCLLCCPLLATYPGDPRAWTGPSGLGTTHSTLLAWELLAEPHLGVFCPRHRKSIKGPE